MKLRQYLLKVTAKKSVAPFFLDTVYMPIFYNFRHITIYWSKIYGFSPFLPTLVSFEAIAWVFP